VVRIERYHPGAGDGALDAAYVAVAHEARRPAFPAGLLPPAAFLLNRVTNVGADHRDHLWLALDGDRPAGGLEVFWWEAPDNRDRAWLHLEVAPERFSPELAGALLAAGAGVLRAAGRESLHVDLPAGHPAAAWLAARGARRGSAEENNVLRLDRVPRAVHEVPPVAGYELVAFDGACPDDLLEPYTRLLSTMNDAPRDDLTMEDWVYTPERLRAFEATVARRGHLLLTVVARSSATGEPAAFNQLVVHPDWPEVVDNEDTAVAVPHRGHRLGRWVKAANLLRVRDDFPETLAVRTWNAVSNTHMLRVNRELGFACEHVWEAWETTLDAVL
jgi:hypothetical protein